MKVLVTGAGGQLGYDVMLELQKRGIECVGSDRSANKDKLYRMIGFDITKKEEVERAITSEKPDAVIHCAAWTNVDGAEEPDNQPLVRSINADGTRNIAEACKKIDAKMLYISTDYVFDGQGTDPWDPDSKYYAPINFYGQTIL